MNISIKWTNLDQSADVKDYVDEKVGHLTKFSNRPLSARVELERDQHHYKGDVFRAEFMIDADGKIVRAEAVAEEIYAAIDLALPKAREQLSKRKSKSETLKRRGARSAKHKS
jgi:putative sigma-54 modulation protein